VRDPSNEHFGYIRVNMHVLFCICGRFDSGNVVRMGPISLRKWTKNCGCVMWASVTLFSACRRQCSRSVPQRKRAFGLCTVVFRAETWRGLVAKRRDNVHICM